MKIGGVRWNIGEGVIDLVIEHHILLIDILHGDAAFLPKRHGPVAVEGAAWIDADGE